MTILLAGDIGGTKTALGLYSREGGPLRPLLTETYASCLYPNLETLVADFMKKAQLTIGRAAFAVAGPVLNGRAKLTNRPWSVDEAQLSDVLGVPAVTLMNDLAATMESIPLLTEDRDLVTINRAESPEMTGNRAVVAPGTGLGEAFAVWDGVTYRPQSSEGGHCDFAPGNDLEMELLRYLRNRIGHVSYESVCSGLGIQNIYRFLSDSGMESEPPQLARVISAAGDPTPLIIQDALDAEHSSPICRKTLDVFLSVLGAEAGNLALKVFATGGIYLGGGIPRRILPLLSQSKFLLAFTDKGRFAELLSRIPIQVIIHPDAALLGAAKWGFDKISREITS
ncbi:MAG: glucokinase [Syntrophales bacterium]|nr:glucokinase [Syntrophales bacterium]